MKSRETEKKFWLEIIFDICVCESDGWIVCGCRAKESHQIAQATAEKNARLKEAFGIGDSYVDGSSFDPNRKAKEEQAKAVAMAQKKYALVLITNIFKTWFTYVLITKKAKLSVIWFQYML